MHDRHGETTHLCGGLGEVWKQLFGLRGAKCGGHGFPLSPVRITCYIQDVRQYRTQDNVTLGPRNATVNKHRSELPQAIRLSESGARVPENMVYGLGIGDP